MKVRRDIASIPARSASDTWQAVVALITSAGSIDADILKAAGSVMESLIADEHPARVPIVVKGSGPRLVIYLLYGEAALEAGIAIDELTWNPTGSADWAITAPCEAGDVGWMNNTLKSRAPRISVHDAALAPADDELAVDEAEKALSIDWGVLNRA